MKLFIAFVAIAAVATATPYNRPTSGVDISAILAAINHPSTDPATAALLMDQLHSILNEDPPISVGPAIVDEESPVWAGPAIVDEESPVWAGPAIIDEESPIWAGPAIVDPAPAAPALPSSPLVQVIINVNGKPLGNPVVVEQPTPALPEIVPTPVIVAEQPEAAPEPVIVSPVVFPTPVEVVEQPVISPEPVIIAPIEVAPVVVLPETLN